jgi:hypothetical protein
MGDLEELFNDVHSAGAEEDTQKTKSESKLKSEADTADKPGAAKLTKPPPEGDKPPKPKRVEKPDPNVQLLKSKIKSYQENKRFGKYLQDSGYDFKKALKMKTEDELKEELVNIGQLLARKGNNDLFDMMARGGLLGIETAAEKTRLKLHGLTDKCFGDEYWADCLEEVKLEYGLGSLIPQVSPLLKLTLLTYLACIEVHKANTVKALSAPVSDKLINEVLGVSKTEVQPQPEAPRPSNVGSSPAAGERIVLDAPSA